MLLVCPFDNQRADIPEMTDSVGSKYFQTIVLFDCMVQFQFIYVNEPFSANKFIHPY